MGVDIGRFIRRVQYPVLSHPRKARRRLIRVLHQARGQPCGKQHEKPRGSTPDGASDAMPQKQAPRPPDPFACQARRRTPRTAQAAAAAALQTGCLQLAELAVGVVHPSLPIRNECAGPVAQGGHRLFNVLEFRAQGDSASEDALSIQLGPAREAPFGQVPPDVDQHTPALAMEAFDNRCVHI